MLQNKVELRYCDGASVSGDKPTPTQVGNATLHFRGRAILDAEIASILGDRGMSKATDVIISGCSAVSWRYFLDLSRIRLANPKRITMQGGLATFLHCDHWAAAIDKATTAETGTGAKVACMPDSGFFCTSIVSILQVSVLLAASLTPKASGGSG